MRALFKDIKGLVGCYENSPNFVAGENMKNFPDEKRKDVIKWSTSGVKKYSDFLNKNETIDLFFL